MLWIQMLLLMRRYHRVPRLLPLMLPKPANSPRSAPQQLLSIIRPSHTWHTYMRFLMIPDLKRICWGFCFVFTSNHFSKSVFCVHFILERFWLYLNIFCWKANMHCCVWVYVYSLTPFSWFCNIYFIQYVFAHITPY